MQRASRSAFAVALLLARAAAAQTPTPTVIPPTFSFGEARLYGVGSEPVAVAAGLFDTNASLDLMVVNYGSDSVTQLTNDGTGRFNRFGTDLVIPDTFPAWVAKIAKDDEFRDEFILVRDPTESEDPEGDFLGRADSRKAGTFLRTNVPVPVVGEAPIYVRTQADLNGDAREDAVVVNSFSDSLSLLLNRPNEYNNQPIETISSPVGVAFGDFNGDGRPDIACVNDGGDLAIHLNLGGAVAANPRFASCPSAGCLFTSPAFAPAAVEAAHLDADGKLDLIVSDAGDQAVLVLRGKGDGTFEAPVSYALGESPEAITSADFNGDGRIDIAVTLPDADAIQVLVGLGNGTLSALPPVAVAAAPSSLIAADFNADGRPDLATASEIQDSVVVLLNGVSPPAFTPTITRTPSHTRTPTRTRTPTQTRTPTHTLPPTSTPTPTRTPTASATASRTPSATATVAPCPDDCDGDRQVGAADVERIVALFNLCSPCQSGGAPAGGCPALAAEVQCAAADENGDGCLMASDLTRALSAVGTACD